MPSMESTAMDPVFVALRPERPREAEPAPSCRSEDAQLIAETLAGQNEAFESLVRPYLNLFTSGIHRILQNARETQEALQEALLTIHAELHLFGARNRFSTWAYRICLNEALLRRRSQMRQRDATFEPLTREGPWRDYAGGAPEAPVCLGTGAGSFQMEMREALAYLSEDQRVVFVLRDLEGMDTDYVARKLGMSRTLVREHRHRALLGLRDELAELQAMA